MTSLQNSSTEKPAADVEMADNATAVGADAIMIGNNTAGNATSVGSTENPSANDKEVIDVEEKEMDIDDNAKKDIADAADGLVVVDKNATVEVKTGDKVPASKDATKEKEEEEEEVLIDIRGVPTSIRYTKFTGAKQKSQIWTFFFNLNCLVNTTTALAAGETRVVNNSDTKSPGKVTPKAKSKMRQKKQIGIAVLWQNRKKTDSYSTLCRLCLEDAQKMEHPHKHGWMNALCNVRSKACNAEKHIFSKHKDHPEVVVFFEKKNAKADSEVYCESDHVASPMKKQINESNAEKLRVAQAEWLARNNIAHEITQSPEFIKMFRIYDKNAVPISRQTYHKKLDKMFEDVSTTILCLQLTWNCCGFLVLTVLLFFISFFR